MLRPHLLDEEMWVQVTSMVAGCRLYTQGFRSTPAFRLETSTANFPLPKSKTDRFCTGLFLSVNVLRMAWTSVRQLSYWFIGNQTTPNPISQKKNIYILPNNCLSSLQYNVWYIYVNFVFSKGIYLGLTSVGQYPVLSCQSPMNKICWPQSGVSSCKVFIHFAVS